ncbi:sialic acid synthase [Coccinella septempunctata]|uniref:sialic acid synthase n=1 Tax=Coccinella septempunctata TaxID=41139 RepID=UPI001D082169|nr:sialic acid synthase [Coccinella septempunctata]
MSQLTEEKREQPSLSISNRIIGEAFPVFFIAEIGQNHQGDINIAKKLIDEAKKCGADCVKFQKTNLSEKFTQKFLEMPYSSSNSWGKTYGEHKEFLEFTPEQFLELQRYAAEKEILFSASAMDIESFHYLEKIQVPFIKIGSGDANNIQLLKVASSYPGPLVISTGMQPFEYVKQIYKLMKENGKENFAFLHCVSSYPTPLEDINLKVIELYKKNFPDIVIGYSGHEIGIDVSIAAAVLGARIIERHITLDRSQKGSDHKCSLLPEEFQEMIEKTRIVQISLGAPRKIIAPSELPCWNKLGKCIVASRKLTQGQKIKEGDLKTKVTHPKGINAIYYEDIIGSILKRDLNPDDLIFQEDFQK